MMQISKEKYSVYDEEYSGANSAIAYFQAKYGQANWESAFTGAMNFMMWESLEQLYKRIDSLVQIREEQYKNEVTTKVGE